MKLSFASQDQDNAALIKLESIHSYMILSGIQSPLHVQATFTHALRSIH